MGCWNKTCALTSMPIIHGEKVVSLFLVNNQTKYISHCYATEFYKPIPILVYGEYNDYGDVENFTGKFDSVLVGLIKERLVEKPQGDNQYHDIPVTKDLMTIDYLYKADYENRLYIDGTKEVHHIQIKESLFNKILEEFTIQDYTFEPKYKTWNVYFKDIEALVETQLPVIIDAFKDFIDVLTSTKESVSKLSNDAKIAIYADMYASAALQQFTKYGSGQDKKHLKLADFLPSERYSEGPYNIGFWSILLTLYGNDPSVAFDFVKETLKFKWLEMFVDFSRKHWHPQTGEGSQTQETKPYELLANFMLDEVKRMRSEYEEEIDEGEEE